MVEISKSKVQQGDVLERLRFIYYADKKAFTNAFAKQGVLVTQDVSKADEELKVLADLALSGDDRKGVLKKPDGTPVILSVIDTADNIIIRHHVLNRNEYKLKFVA